MYVTIRRFVHATLAGVLDYRGREAQKWTLKTTKRFPQRIKRDVNQRAIKASASACEMLLPRVADAASDADRGF